MADKAICEVFHVESKNDRPVLILKWPWVALLVVSLAVSFVVGLLIGHFCVPVQPAAIATGANSQFVTTDLTDTNARYLVQPLRAQQLLFANIDSNRIQYTHKNLSSRPSLSGTDADRLLAYQIKQMWLDAGLDTVRVQDYDVRLGYPNTTLPNSVSILAANGTVILTSSIREQTRVDGDPQGDFVQPYLVYSASGVVTGDPLFANDCEIEDFKELLKLNISVNGTIVLCSYRGGRSRKIMNAQKYGAIGVVMMHTPKNLAPLGDDASKVYPNTQYIPSDGVERGSIAPKIGDPETAFMPSRPYAYRSSSEEIARFMPSIPAQPIGYGDALKLMSYLSNQPMPANWSFGYANQSQEFQIGPGLTDGAKLKLQVHNSVERRTIYNVIGLIDGWLEPDRYVIVGNHKDSWVLGAVDAKSGTATLMETVRAFGKLKSSGWRPRRTLLFAQWSGEEQGLIGSAEFNDEFRRQLESHAVVYLNVDIACMGTYILISGGSPLLRALTHDAAKQVPNPNQTELAAGYKTLYDIWLSRFNETLSPDDVPRPAFRRRSGGSDFMSFGMITGVPYFDLSYYGESQVMFPAYHTAYDTYNLLSKFYDPEFKYQQAVSRLCTWMLYRAADDPLLPFSFLHYAFEVDNAMKDLQAQYGEFIANTTEFLSASHYLSSAVQTFRKAALAFDNYLDNVRNTNISDLQRRQINDKLKDFERHFIVTQSQLGSTPSFAFGALETHTILQFSRFSASSTLFAPLSDALFIYFDDIRSRAVGEIPTSEYQGYHIGKSDVLRYFSLTTYTIESATRSLLHDPIDGITH